METIYVKDAKSKALIKTALEREIALCQNGIEATKNHIHEYEQKYQLPSETFIIKYERGELGDDTDMMIWHSELQALIKLQSDYQKMIEVNFAS